MRRLGMAVLAGVAVSMLCGCGGSGGSDGNTASASGPVVLTGTWEVSQITIDGSTTPVSGFQTTGTLTLNEDGTFVLQSTGLLTARYSGTYTVADGRFTMHVNETGNTITGSYELGPDLLELTLDTPVAVMTASIQAAVFVRD